MIIKSDDNYPPEFFTCLQVGSKKSAEQVVPLLMQLIAPNSVVDVGCGTGVWLNALLAAGVKDILGIDGKHVPLELLEIPVETFKSSDLAKIVHLDREFDLVLSLEVAEHLPPEAAEIFVDSLVRMGDVILFSAAVPLQGGDGHVNEQWLDYWVDKFAAKGFLATDCIRDQIWTNAKVEWWYAQNILLFYNPDSLSRYPCLKKQISSAPDSRLSVIHPRHYLQVKWDYMVQEAALDIVDIVPIGETFVLIDNNQTDHKFEPARNALKFPTEKEWYWVDPPAEQAAIEELDRLITNGANYIVIAWSAYWWLADRKKIVGYLNSKFDMQLRNERVLVFGPKNFVEQVN